VAEITLRFFGRYVLANEWAQGMLTGKVTMLAPILKSGPQDPEHMPYLGIPRAAVSRRSGETTLRPSLRTVTDGAAHAAEYCLWDLSGANVKVGTGTQTTTFTDPIVRLEDLERLQGRTPVLDQSNLKANAKVGAAIEVTGGKRVARAVFANQCQYLAKTDAEDGDIGNDRIIRPPRQEADLFEVTYTVSDADPYLPIEIERGGATSKVVVRVKSGATAVASFTNICPTLPPPLRYDVEFGGYYDLLTASGADRLIPMVVHLGPAADCDVPCSIDYP
jgi:hypothetical protein